MFDKSKQMYEKRKKCLIPPIHSNNDIFVNLIPKENRKKNSVTAKSLNKIMNVKHKPLTQLYYFNYASVSLA